VSSRNRTTLVWILRLAGVALLVWVLATQVQYDDELVLKDGGVLRGRVVASGGAYRIEDLRGGEDATRTVPAEVVATRAYGGREVPDVTYGARTLLGRLGTSLPSVTLVLLGLAALVVLTAWRWRMLMRGVGLELSFSRATRLTFVGGFFNLAVPGSTGGDVVKAWYAARETGAGARAVLSVFVDRFVGLFALVLFAAGVLVVWARGPAYETPRALVLLLLAGSAVGGALVLSRGLRRRLGLGALFRRLPFQRILEELRAGARLYRGHVPALLASVGVSLANHAGSAAAAWYLARALGTQGVSLGAAMALVPIVNLLSAVPLLPGGWGVGELAFAFFFGLVGVPPTEAVGLSVVFRLATLGVNLPGGVLWIFWRGHPSTARIAAEVEAATAAVAASEEGT
jgi:uncharacterized protein (TIRG00374 family)